MRACAGFAVLVGKLTKAPCENLSTRIQLFKMKLNNYKFISKNVKKVSFKVRISLLYN